MNTPTTTDAEDTAKSVMPMHRVDGTSGEIGRVPLKSA